MYKDINSEMYVNRTGVSSVDIVTKADSSLATSAEVKKTWICTVDSVQPVWFRKRF
jgi:hypothetical protein